MPIGPITPGTPVVVTPDSPLPPSYLSVDAPTATMPVQAAHIQALTLVTLNIQEILRPSHKLIAIGNFVNDDPGDTFEVGAIYEDFTTASYVDSGNMFVSIDNLLANDILEIDAQITALSLVNTGFARMAFRCGGGGYVAVPGMNWANSDTNKYCQVPFKGVATVSIDGTCIVRPQGMCIVTAGQHLRFVGGGSLVVKVWRAVE